MSSALSKQVGGDHYKQLGYQPVEFVVRVDLNFIQGAIVKYVTRYKSKNGKEDLEKALHFSELGSILKPLNHYDEKNLHNRAQFASYCELNKVSVDEMLVIRNTLSQDWREVSRGIKHLIDTYVS